MFARTLSIWRRLIGAAPSTPKGREERRRRVRYPSQISARLSINDAQKAGPAAVLIKDISTGGASVVVDQPVAAGTMVTLELGQGETLKVLACVVHATEEGGLWSLGCSFSRGLTRENLESFGAGGVKAADQRSWTRSPCRLRARLQQVGDDPAASAEAEVVNLSPSGVGLRVGNAIEAGSLLSVDLLPERGKPATILACVVHVSSQAGGDWLVGCNFIRQLRQEEWSGLEQSAG